ncbi:Protein Dok-7 [Merluccius polli]|uniref:Protein Dok-7 n=1 Tax=Merluccius polli TaxID=89951 RepID=A0AA47MZF5_MERPO|nr:Protein Dok-7 [Merluccius polli]
MAQGSRCTNALQPGHIDPEIDPHLSRKLDTLRAARHRERTARKVSQIAALTHCLSLLVYKDKKKTKDKEKSHYHKERLNVKIEAICGLEPGPGYDGVSYSLSILCLAYSVALGFHSRDAQAAWEARIRYSLGEVHRFSVQVQPGTKLESGPASLHLCNTLLVLTRDAPPIVIGHWKLSELRRYGAVPDGFVFEGGSRCGHWTGVFYLSSAEGEQISFHLDCIARGISPSRASRGPRPPLPGDPTPYSSEEQINLETSELEKRLSMLSHCSRPCSTASTHSSISSSSSSQSDSSFGSRLLVWAEPTTALSRLSNETTSSSSTWKASLTSSDGALYNAATAGAAAACPLSSNQGAAHGLHDSGRQNSLDSGIGVASASSQSSGSFSSHTSSLDAASQAGGEDFGSLASLPFASSSRPTSPLRALLPPSSLPPPPTSPLCMLVNRQSAASPGPGPGPASRPSTADSGAFARLSAASPAPGPVSRPSTADSGAFARLSAASPAPGAGPVSRPSTADSGAFARLGDEYQVPGLLPGPRYDTPRSLLQGPSRRDTRAQGGPPAMGRDRRDRRGVGAGGPADDSPAELSFLWARAQSQASVSSSHSWGGERAPSVDSAGRCAAPRSLFTGCPVCGGSQCVHTSDNYIIPEQWRSAGGRGLTQVSNYFRPELLPTVGAPSTSGDCVSDSDGLIKRLMAPERSQAYLAPSVPATPPKAPRLYRMPMAGMCHRPPEAALSPSLERRLCGAGGPDANYVNFPVSPAVAQTRRELVNTELHLKDPSTYPVPRPSSAARGDSVRYTHLDMAAMETVHKVAVAHGQGKEPRRSLLGNQRGAHT